ncbi:MAG: Na+-translocating ferredoxin:NAD+ oxidoreductase RnfC subunit [Ulvibacter sp.]|jgi:Na+-translocating ferredoxin:NAD+ oxidoreductase RnfC subunit
MKTKASIISFILISFLFGSQIVAQINTPNKENLKSLADNMDNCKAIKTVLEGKAFFLNENQETIIDVEYLEIQKKVASARLCIASTKAEVAKLKKTYPEWFESHLSGVVVGKQVYTPSWINYQVAVIVGSFSRVFKAFDGVQAPKFSF